MVEGSPDYTKLVQILGRDAENKLVTVRLDSYGRIILLPYGTMNVDGEVAVSGGGQDKLVALAVDAEGRLIMVPYGTTTVDGAVAVSGGGQDKLIELAVDAEGRLIMLPYGWDGSAYRKLLVDEEGRMVSAIKGAADVRWGLRGWWKFIASEETTIKDYSGYGNNGTGKSGAAEEAKYKDGVIGQCFLFDGVNDYIDCGTDSSLDFTTEDFSLELWIKAGVLATAGVLVYKGEHAVRGYYLTLHQTGYIYLMTCQAGEFQETRSESDITAGDWFHIVVVRDGTKGYIYINAVDRTLIQPDITNPITSGETFCIGTYGGAASFYIGDMDEVRVYARALTPAEVAWRYEHTNPATGKPTRMVAVDNEGRMMVNVNDLPYKDQILEEGSEAFPGAGDYSLFSAIVPSGTMWIVTAATMHVGVGTSNALSISIYDGTDYFVIEYGYEAAAMRNLVFRGQMILKAGDKVHFFFDGITGASTGHWCINGYALHVT